MTPPAEETDVPVVVPGQPTPTPSPTPTEVPVEAPTTEPTTPPVVELVPSQPISQPQQATPLPITGGPLNSMVLIGVLLMGVGLALYRRMRSTPSTP